MSGLKLFVAYAVHPGRGGYNGQNIWPGLAENMGRVAAAAKVAAEVGALPGMIRSVKVKTEQDGERVLIRLHVVTDKRELQHLYTERRGTLEEVGDQLFREHIYDRPKVSRTVAERIDKAAHAASSGIRKLALMAAGEVAQTPADHAAVAAAAAELGVEL